MRPILVAAATLFLCCAAFSQKSKDIPAFGKVEKADLDMKSCAFDKGAEAVVLFDVAQVYCSFFPQSSANPVRTEMERHIRIKILTDKGLERANIHIPFYSAGRLEDVHNISAQTYNLDNAGNVVATKVEKKLIYRKTINKKYEEQVFTFPEVKAGSIIEYRYTVSSTWFNGLQTWYFQRSIPVAFSRYTLDFPQEFEVDAAPFASLPIDMKDKSNSSRNVRMYSMQNIPGLRDEPYITCDEDYLQHLRPRLIAINLPTRRISLVPDWIKVIKDLMEDEDFGVQLKRNIPRTAELDQQLKSITDSFQRMNTVYNYVRKNMEWDGSSSIWAMAGVKSAWKDKKGTSGEINMILVNLLKDAGLNAHPILVSTKDHGRVRTAMATIDQFNKVMAYVTIGQKFYVLDATDKYTPVTMIPESVMFTEGMVIEKIDTYEWGWKMLWDDSQVFKKIVVMTNTINGDGTMTGQAYVSNSGYARLKHLPELKENRNKFVEKYFQVAPGIRVDSFSVENENTDSLPLVHQLRFSQPISSSGDYTYFSTNLFCGLEKNPFVADTRASDVFFGSNQVYNIIGNFKIPEGYSFDALPKNMRMIMPDTSISIYRVAAAEGTVLNVRIVLEFKKPFYSPDEYPDFREFYKKLFDMLNEPFVIKRKKS